jgi:S1-C subfamily serine protease
MTVKESKRSYSDDNASIESPIGKKQRIENNEIENYDIIDSNNIEIDSNTSEYDDDDVVDVDVDYDVDNNVDNDTKNISNIPYIPQSETHWQKTVEKVVKSVVSIHFMQPTNFDTETSLVSEATGFVVDSTQGIILTNRHVVGPGPFIGYAVFDNHEEVEVTPIYRDPVHDFGFLKFDISKVKYMKIQQLELHPELARVGEEIRVIGNDSGEKLSILSGFISRLDRNAPDYGANTYNDFNTEYIQAAASASGGSSGSPVVNIDGHAVALQAGGNSETSTDFFLPVWRVKRALEKIQLNEIVTRGTIQVQWTLEPFDKCRRLGLTADIEEKVRKLGNDKNGMLIASITLPEGPADGLIKEGDCLISINNELITSFIQVDKILDDNVNNECEFLIQRNGLNIKNKIKIGNLHDITPNQYITVCGATFNELSYQLARIYGIAVKGCYVSDASGSFQLGSTELNNCWIIDSIDDKPTPTLNDFVEVMKTIPDKSFIPVKYHHLTDIHVPLFKNIFIDRHWSSSFKRAIRNDKTGIWDFETIQKEPIKSLKLNKKTARFLDLPTEFENCKQLNRSFVQVDAIYQLPLDSFGGHVRRVHGVVIDAKNGFVLVSRHAVCHDLCDINITIAESIIVPAKVIFLHPTKGYAIIRYDPNLVDAPVQTPKFSNVPLERGDKVVFIGYNKSLRPVVDETKISDIGVMNIPTNSNAPKYKATNVEAILIDSTSGQKCHSGILCNKEDGVIRGLWLSCDGEDDKLYTTGINITDIMWELEFLKNNEEPDLKIIDVEFSSVSIASARINGVPEEWIDKVETSKIDKFQFLYVPTISVSLDNKPSCLLKPGDIILTANNKLITCMRDIDNVVKLLKKDENIIKFKVVREKKMIDLDIELTRTKSFITDRVVFWSGCALQNAHHGVRQTINNLPSEVYCTTVSNGSPGRFYAVGITNFITHVNEIPTKTLEDFLKVVKEVKDNSYVKLRIVTFDNIPMAQTLKVNYHYFPTVELKKIDGVWKSFSDEKDNKD